MVDDVLWTVTDPQKSVRFLIKYDPTTDTTSVVRSLNYDSFDNMVSQTSPTVETLFQFTGRLFDADTGLQNNLNRWYDPEIARWLSEDPISFAAGDANLYRYVSNNPAAKTDPTGLAEWNDSRWDWINPISWGQSIGDPIGRKIGGWAYGVNDAAINRKIRELLSDNILDPGGVQAYQNTYKAPKSATAAMEALAEAAITFETSGPFLTRPNAGRFSGGSRGFRYNCEKPGSNVCECLETETSFNPFKGKTFKEID